MNFKRMAGFLLALVLILSQLPAQVLAAGSVPAAGPAAVTGLTGAGTQEDPYRISSEAELIFAAEQLNGNNSAYTGKTFRLTDDITMSDDSFPMIDEFTGVFDGDGHTISNLTIKDETTGAVSGYGVAFIRVNRGTVENLTFRETDISTQADSSGDGYSGAAVAVAENQNGGVIRRVAVYDSTVYAPKMSKAAGIASINGRDPGVHAEITDCLVADSSFTAGPRSGGNAYGVQLGGIAGYSATSVLENCYVSNVTLTGASSTNSPFNAGLICAYANEVDMNGNVAVSGKITYASGFTDIYAGAICPRIIEEGAQTHDNLAVTGGLTIEPAGTPICDKPGTAVEAADLTEEKYAAIGWNLDATWKLEGGVPVLRAPGDMAPLELAGSGTAGDPYQIADKEDLLYAVGLLNSRDVRIQGKSLLLTADIDMSGENFPMIDEFTGVFDGDGHKISNLTINDDTTGKRTEYRVGFVRVNTGSIQNIVFDHPVITSAADCGADGYSGVAVVAGENGHGGSIRACAVIDAEVTALKASKVAGITALNGRYEGINASISNCFVSGSFTCGPRSGQYGPQPAGIAGYSATSSILNCVADVDITIEGDSEQVYAGIICAYPNTVTLRGNVAYGGSITTTGNNEKEDFGRIYAFTGFQSSLTLNNNLACGDITFNGSTAGSEIQNGRTVSADALGEQATYEDIGYDFTLMWKMENGHPMPQPFSYGNDQVNRLTATIYGDPATQMGFTWYYESGEDAVLRVSASPDMSEPMEFAAEALETENGWRLQSAAQGLQPGTRYYYQVGSTTDNVFSAVGSFTTAPEDGGFTFLSLSDTEAKDFTGAETAAISMASALQAAPDAAFLLHSGDFVSAGRGEEGWQDLLFQSADLLLDLPLAPTAGDEDGEGFADHFYVSRAAEGKDYYSFDYANAHFAVLDTNDDAVQCLSEAQLTWLRQDVTAARAGGADWIILSLHKGPYTSGAHAGDADIAALRDVLLPVMEELEIDLVIQGHDHILGRTYPLASGGADDCATYTETVNGKRFEYSISPEGTVYLEPGSAGTERDSQIGAMTTEELDAYISGFARSDQRGVPTFAVVTVDGGRLCVGMYEIKMEMCPTMIDGFGIDKEVSAVEAQIAGGEMAPARQAYDALSDDQRRQVSNYHLLVEAEAPGLAEDGGLWLDDTAAQRRAVTVRNDTNLTFTDVPVLVRLEQAPSERMQFYTAEGERLPSEVETYDADGVTTVWVRVPEAAAESVTGLWVYFGGSDGEDPAAVWNDDYRLVEHFAGSSEDRGTRTDSTGSQTGTVRGSLASVTVDGDAAAQFDNASITYASIGDDYDRISVSAVFSMTQEDLQKIESTGALVSKYLQGDPTGHNAYLLGVASDGDLYTDYTCRWWRSNATQHKTYRNDLPAPDGTPHLVTLTYDGFTVGTYLDGEPVSEETVFIESGTFLDRSIPTVIGAFSDGAEGGFHGTIHEVQITGERTNAQWEAFRYACYLGDAVTVGPAEQKEGGLTLAADAAGRGETLAAGQVQIAGVAGRSGALTADVDGAAVDLGTIPAGAFNVELPLSGTGSHRVTLRLTADGQTAQCVLQLETADTAAPAQPALSAESGEDSQTLTVQPAEEETDTLQVEFYQAESAPLTGETLRVCEGSTSDAVPGSGIDPRRMEFVPADSVQRTTTGEGGENPYQIYEVTLTLDQLSAGTYHFSWQGQSDRQVHAYAYNFDTGAWDKLASTTGAGALAMDATVEGTEYTEDSRLYLMLFRGLGMDPADRDGYAPEEGQYDFTMFWNSDTQYQSQFYPEMFLEQYQWIADSYEELNGIITFNTGDVTNRSNLNYEYNWRVADDGYQLLEEAGVPYTIAWGNHDYRYDGKPNEERLYEKYFPLSRFEENAGSWTLAGSCNGTDGMALTGEFQGSKIMLLSLGYYLDAEVIDWAADLVPEYPDYSVIILTHNFSSGGQITGLNTSLLKTKVIDPNENVKLVLCGHIDGVDLIAPYGSSRQFYSILQDYQGEGGNPPHGGDGLMRIIQVDLENDLVYFHTYSPVTGATLSNWSSGTYRQVDGLYQKNKDEFAIRLDLGGGTEPRSFATESLYLYAGDAVQVGAAQASPGQTASCAGNGATLWYAVLTDSSGNRTVTPVQPVAAAEVQPVLQAEGGSGTVTLRWENLPQIAAGITVEITADGQQWHTLSDAPLSAEDACSGAYLAAAAEGASGTVKVLGLANGTQYTFRVTAAGVSCIASAETDSPSGGGSGSATYSVTVAGDIANGAVAVTPRRASGGATVTITATPEEGYEVEQVTVTDSRGNEIALTDAGNGKYSFIMPRGGVSVTAEFALVGEEPEPSALPFTDVSENAWYYEAVKYAYDNGLMNGTSSSAFSPERTITRGQIVTILWRLSGSPVVNYLMDFSDVDTATYYGEAVRWAASEGVVDGYGGGLFGPDDPVTREQLAAMLYRYAQYKSYDTTQGGMAIREYADYDQISDYALEAMDWAVNAGLLNGTGAAMLDPKGTATRAQAAAMLQRFCGQYEAN